MYLWSVFWEISGVLGPQQRDRLRSSQGSGNSNHEATSNSQGVEELPRQCLLHQEVYPWFSFDHFNFHKDIKERKKLQVGGSTANGFPKAIADYDEPPHGTGASSQKTVVALLGLKPVCH